MKRKNKLKIGFMDSGAGGLSVLYEVLKTCDIESTVYYGDNARAPYGNRGKRDLLYLAEEGVDKLRAEGVDAIVFACGTLSTCVLFEMKRIYPEIRFYGTFPPLESYAMSGENYLAVTTRATAEAMKKSFHCARIFAAENLASDIEKNLFSLSEVRLENHLKNLSAEPGIVILGCTHFNLIKNTFRAYFPNAKIVSGAENTAKMIASDCRYIYNNVFQGENEQKNLETRENCQKSNLSDHFCLKKYGVLTTFASKIENYLKIMPNKSPNLYFCDKKVKFIGSEWKTNLLAFANICSNLTE